MIFSYSWRPGSEFEIVKTTDSDLAKKSKSERNGYANHYARIAVIILILVGFGRACAPVRCAHPSFWTH